MIAPRPQDDLVRVLAPRRGALAQDRQHLGVEPPAGVARASGHRLHPVAAAEHEIAASVARETVEQPAQRRGDRNEVLARLPVALVLALHPAGRDGPGVARDLGPPRPAHLVQAQAGVEQDAVELPVRGREPLDPEHESDSSSSESVRSRRTGDPSRRALRTRASGSCSSP